MVPYQEQIRLIPRHLTIEATQKILKKRLVVNVRTDSSGTTGVVLVNCLEASPRGIKRKLNFDFDTYPDVDRQGRYRSILNLDYPVTIFNYMHPHESLKPIGDNSKSNVCSLVFYMLQKKIDRITSTKDDHKKYRKGFKPMSDFVL